MAGLLSGLRQLAAPLRTAATAAQARGAASAPCVYDFLIPFHVIDADGKRHVVKGLAGRSVASAMHESGIFEDFDDFCYGPDNPEPDTHLYVSKEMMSQLGSISTAEQEAIELCGHDIRPKCALRCFASLLSPLFS